MAASRGPYALLAFHNTQATAPSFALELVRVLLEAEHPVRAGLKRTFADQRCPIVPGSAHGVHRGGFCLS